MNKTLKYGLISVGIILVVFLALVALVAATFDPNDYKPLIVKLVQEKKQRTLKLEGDIKLTFFPRIGADLGRLALSEHGSDKEFAAVDSARASLALLPLLKKQLVVDRIRIDGIRGRLVRYPDGSTNIDDLLKKEESEQFKFDIEGVSVTRAALAFDDQMGGRKLDISGMEFESGRLANNQPGKVELKFTLQGDNPKIDAQVALASGLLFDTEAKAITLDKLTVSLAGKYGADSLDIRLASPKFELEPERFAGHIDLTAKLMQPRGNLDLVLSVPALTGKGSAVRAESFTLDVSGKQGDNTIKSRIASPFSANLDTRQFSLDKLVASLNLSGPAMPGALDINLGGAARLDLAKQDAHLELAGKIDDSPLKARLGISHFDAPAYDFDIAIDRLDVDRYLSSAKPEAKQPEKPLDFGFLKNLNANGQLRIGTLKVANIKSSNIKLNVKAGGGNLNPSASSAVQ
ncbi:MAG: AsmA family protein [Sulfuricella sp.]|nr:AsmA family protein [Sulfuricella sp.]